MVNDESYVPAGGSDQDRPPAESRAETGAGGAITAPRSRRALLATTGALVAGLAGCAGGPGPDSSPTTSTSPPPSTSRPPTTRQARLHVEHVDDIRRDDPVAVFPPELAGWLRTAARTGEQVRGTGSTATPGQPPVLFAYDRVRLVSDDAAVAGTYRLAGSGGMVYTYKVGARAVSDPPAKATVRDPENLSAARREFVREAVRGHAEMDPSTAIGSWVRRDFFDGYVRLDGTVYTGYEIQQTDVGFFSRTVYYDFHLEPVDATGDAAVPLALPFIDTAGRQELADVVTRESRVYPVTVSIDGFPAAVRSLLRTYDFLLTHAAVFRVTVEE